MNGNEVRVKPPGGWVIGNGQGNRWRCVWKWETNSEWTDDVSKAIKFATRDDAEAFAADDEDAWLIQEVSIPAIEPTPDPRAAVIARLVEAAEALGAMPEGYCFCRAHRIGDDSKVHEPECADLRAALAAAKAVQK